VQTAITASAPTKQLLITFRFVRSLYRSVVSGDDEPAASTHNLIVRHVISSEGKFCSGKVNMTAMEYASWTVVATTPGGSDVVRTVLTS